MALQPGFNVSRFSERVAAEAWLKLIVSAASATTRLDVDDPVRVPVPFITLFNVSVLLPIITVLFVLMVRGPTATEFASTGWLLPTVAITISAPAGGTVAPDQLLAVFQSVFVVPNQV